MSLTAFYDEEAISVGEDTLTLAIDFRVIDLIEHRVAEAGSITPMTEVIAMLFANAPPRSVMGKVLWALLRRHHEAITLDVAAGLMFTEHRDHIATAMRSLIVRAMNFGKVKDKNPPLRRGASVIS